MDEEKFEEKVIELQEDEKIKQQFEHNKTKAEELLKDKKKLEHFLERLEHKLAQIPMAGKYLSDVPVLISLVKAYIGKTYVEIPIGSIIAIIGALIYVFSTMDLIPDIIPVIGILDDAAVIALAYKLVHNDVVEYKVWRDANRPFSSAKEENPKTLSKGI